MTSYFTARSISSALFAEIYSTSGWPGVCLIGPVLPILAQFLWIAEVTRARKARDGQPGRDGDRIV